jgi:hypothetical protein
MLQNTIKQHQLSIKKNPEEDPRVKFIVLEYFKYELLRHKQRLQPP